MRQQCNSIIMLRTAEIKLVCDALMSGEISISNVKSLVRAVGKYVGEEIRSQNDTSDMDRRQVITTTSYITTWKQTPSTSANDLLIAMADLR